MSRPSVSVVVPVPAGGATAGGVGPKITVTMPLWKFAQYGSFAEALPAKGSATANPTKRKRNFPGRC